MLFRSPISKEKLSRAITKYKNLLELKIEEKTENVDLISEMLETLRNVKEIYKSHFLIHHKDKLLPISIDEIAYFFTENKNIKVVTFSQKTFYMENTLDDIFKQLNPKDFFRANRQYIISHKAIKDISIWFGNKLSVNLSVPVTEKAIISKAKVSEFKSWYTK